MYGTVGRAHIKAENRDAFVEVLRRQSYEHEVPGFRQAWVMFPENREDEVLLVAMFEDRDSYRRNAEDPEQDRRYREYRALLEDDPEWTDGEWISPEGAAGA